MNERRNCLPGVFHTSFRWVLLWKFHMVSNDGCCILFKKNTLAALIEPRHFPLAKKMQIRSVGALMRWRQGPLDQMPHRRERAVHHCECACQQQLHETQELGCALAHCSGGVSSRRSGHERGFIYIVCFLRFFVFLHIV